MFVESKKGVKKSGKSKRAKLDGERKSIQLYNVWAPLGLTITLAQAAHVKNVPGRKTDMNDSHWLAQLHRFGLVRSSFIPDDIFQRMRLLSRHRTNLTHNLSRVKNRVQRVLEDETLNGVQWYQTSSANQVSRYWMPLQMG